MYEVGEDYTSTRLKANDHESLNQLLKTLQDIHTIADRQTEVIIATAKIEAISLLGDTSMLHHCLSEDPNVDSTTIKQFASTLNDPNVKSIIYSFYNEK